jgi:hypothetical protein
MRVRPRLLAPSAGCALLAALAAGAPLRAQDPMTGWSAAVGARAIPLATHATPATGGEDRTEVYLTQPVVMGHAMSRGGRLELTGMLNLEGATLRRGELNAGIWGEGYIDRRHPHTYLHELAATAWIVGGASSARALTLTAGRGFAPFGTDDPMSRRLVKFPANHHLAQILERYVATAGVRAGPAVVEAGVFSGNEPTSPRDLTGLERFGDSWSTRVTIFPSRAAELQASYARVASPELPPSSESEHRKVSVSARVERSRPGGAGEYGLLEWARTEELFTGVRAHDFRTLLAEGALVRRGIELGARFERTTRPEEERLVDPFRSPVPPTDVQLLGVTRWHIVSARVALAGSENGSTRVRPFVEVGRAAVTKEFPRQVFDPRDFFGDDRIWNLSLGARLEAGMSHARMGRYGAALAPSPAVAEHHH